MVRRQLITLVLTLLVVGGAFGANFAAGNTPALGLDLQGGASVTLTPVGEYEAGALDIAVEVIRQRVDSLGVAEPEIIRQGDTVVVNLPGVKDQERALELVGRTGSVEMRPVINVIENPELSPTTTAAGVTATTVAGETTTTVVSDTTLADPAGGLGSSRRASTATTAPPTTDDTTPAPTGDGADENVDVDPNTGLAPGQTVLPSRDGTLLYLLGPAEATGEV
ncbi:MAG: hypothetical protein RLY50_1412, partial [Actinomycetota bacterium]